MHERALEEAAARVRQLRRRVRDAGVLALVAAVLALALTALSTPLAVSFAVAALIEGVVAAAAALRLRATLEMLALVGRAYAIPEVKMYAGKIAGVRGRRRTAEAFQRMLCQGDDQAVLWLPERVHAVERELRTLADALTTADGRLGLIGAVACRQLVTNPVRSPLYNPELSVEELDARIHHITRAFGEDRRAA
jgi:hypothetical protein